MLKTKAAGGHCIQGRRRGVTGVERAEESEVDLFQMRDGREMPRRKCMILNTLEIQMYPCRDGNELGCRTRERRVFSEGGGRGVELATNKTSEERKLLRDIVVSTARVRGLNESNP